MSVWSRACVPVTHFISFPTAVRHLLQYPTTTLATRACMRAPLALLGHEGRRTKWVDLVMSLSALLAAGNHRCDWRSGFISPPSLVFCERNFPPRVCLTERGKLLYAQPQLLSTPGPSPIIYIDAWTYGCPLSERVSFVALDTTSPHILRPLERRGNKKNLVRSTMIEYWLHSASRIRPPLTRKARLKLL